MPSPSRARWSLVLSGFITLGGITGCEEDEHEDEGPPSEAVCKPGSTLSWDNFGEKFMTDYCTRCHSSSLAGSARQGAPSDHNFESLELVQEQIEHIDQQAAAGPGGVNTEMPLGTPAPTEAERKMLGEWLACGAP